MGIRDMEQLHEMERKVDIAKGNMFCNAMFLSGQAEEIFGKLKAEDYLHGLEASRESFLCEYGAMEKN